MRFKLFFLILIFSLPLFAQKKVKKLSPYQAAIEKCFAAEIPAAQINDNKKLYFEITKKYTLQASETTFREVDYVQDGEKRKLRFDEGSVKIFKVDAEENVNLYKTEDLKADFKNSGMRYKVNSIEAMLNQLLNRASIKSDFIKTTEFRAKQVVLDLVWANDQIKKLKVQFSSEQKPTLECQKSGSSDICECRP